MSTGSALAAQQDWHEQHRTHEASAGRFRLNSLTERFPAHKGIAKNTWWELEPNAAQANALRSAKLWTMFTARHSASPRHRQQLQLERAARSLQREPLELGCQALQVALRAWLSLWNAQMPQASCASSRCPPAGCQAETFRRLKLKVDRSARRA